jgi:hypothetical protein
MTALICATLLALLQAASAPPPPAVRVLFVGNSLTYANDLPAMVSSLAAGSGHRLEYELVAFPDFSLEDHWQQGEARRAIARGSWDFVVLQQGPSALLESRALLVTFAKRFDEEVRKAGARTAMYMVWPSAARRGDFAGVQQSYAAAAKAVGGTLLPAGAAWLAAWGQNSRLELYGPDRFHPSVSGSHLAALVIHERLLGPVAPDLPAPPGVAPGDLPTLRQAARIALDR